MFIKYINDYLLGLHCIPVSIFLQMIHSTVIDTSIVFPHKMGPPKKRALKTLCREHLNKIIQESGMS
jgi:RNA exonuclease 1